MVQFTGMGGIWYPIYGGLTVHVDLETLKWFNKRASKFAGNLNSGFPNCLLIIHLLEFCAQIFTVHMKGTSLNSEGKT